MWADLRGFILVEYFIGYDFVRMCLSAPGIGVRGPGVLGGDSNLIFASGRGREEGGLRWCGEVPQAIADPNLARVKEWKYESCPQSRVGSRQ